MKVNDTYERFNTHALPPLAEVFFDGRRYSVQDQAFCVLKVCIYMRHRRNSVVIK